MIEKVKAFVKEKGLIKEGDRILVGLSGGADSICLMLCLKKIFGNRISLLAVHINHGIRGEEAERDEEFVKAFCDRQSIPYLVKNYDIPKLAKEEKKSEEEMGRIIRYQAFEEILRERDFTKIAVAHNQEDVVETFLFNLARGSGLAGLSGIKAQNGRVIRPLLPIERREIESFLKEEGENFMVDSSNLSFNYTRNVIRNQILPKFQEGVNEKTVPHIFRVIESVREADDFIKKSVEEKFSTYVEKREEGSFIKKELLNTSGLLQKEVIYKVLAEVGGNKKDIVYLHIVGILNLFSKKGSGRMDLPYGVEAVKGYDGILLRKKREKKKEKLPWKLKLEMEEIEEIREVKAENGILTLEFISGEVKKLPKNGCIKWFDYDRITDNIVIRNRKEGDFLVISEDGRKKKLKSYFMDEKIPREERDFIPLVASGKEILWIVGGRTGEGARISLATRKLLKITIENMEEEVR